MPSSAARRRAHVFVAARLRCLAPYACSRQVYLEAYTSILGVDKAKLVRSRRWRLLLCALVSTRVATANKRILL